jgi:ABC-2 type transport system ATP-binding protein
LRSRGTAILLTTHDLEQAEELADRVGMLIEGHLELEGSPAELVAATFGDNSEVRLTLTRAPTEAHQQTLERQGLVPTRESTVWAGPLASGLEGLEALSHALAATGIDVGEFRVRDPGLRSLFLRLTGSEL